MKKIALLIVVFILTIVSFASENQLIIARANKAYTDGMFNNAVEL